MSSKRPGVARRSGVARSCSGATAYGRLPMASAGQTQLWMLRIHTEKMTAGEKTAGTPSGIIVAPGETTVTGTKAMAGETIAALSAKRATSGEAASTTDRATGETSGPESTTLTAGSMPRADLAVELEEEEKEAPVVREANETALAPTTATVVTGTGKNRQPRMIGAGGSQRKTTVAVVLVPLTAGMTEGTPAATEEAGRVV